MSSQLPQYSWQSAATELNKKTYVVIVDYYSRYPEVLELKSTTSGAVISTLKSVLSMYVIPQTIRSDSGPHYTSEEFARFASTYGFKRVTSSPHFPQSNGPPERTVQTVKNLLKLSTDPYLALLSYRATLLPWCKLSPGELLMGRQLRTSVPQLSQKQTPQWLHLVGFREANKLFRSKQKRNYDNHHGVRQQSEIPDDSEVWITTDKEPVRIPHQLIHHDPTM